MNIHLSERQLKWVRTKKGDARYYPFGLTMAGISDKALKTQYAENKYRFNDGTELANKDFSDGSGLELYETDFRGYDPQLGRFWQIDPLGEMTEDWSPYAFASDNPILLNDPLGLSDDSAASKPIVPEPKPKPPVCNRCSLPKPDPSKNIPAPPSNVPAPINNEKPNYKWYEFFNDHNPGGDFLYELNRYNPLAQLVNLGYTVGTNHDSYGVKQNTSQAVINLAATIPVGRLSSTIVNVTANIGLTEVRQGLATTLSNANNIAHILASKHNLGQLLSKAGSEVNIIRRLYLSLGQAGNLPISGVFEKVVNIYGYNVTIRGAVVNGIPRISTAFIP